MKGWIYLIFLIIICSFAYSLSVSINSHTENEILSGTETVTATVDLSGIANLTFLYEEQDGTTYVIEIDTVANKTQYGSTDNFDTTAYSDTTQGYLIANGTNEATNEEVIHKIQIQIDNSPNNLPIFTIIPDMAWPEDEINTSLNLSNYFSDPDSDPLTYSIQTAPTDITAEIIDDDIARFTPNANFTGLNTVIFQASDGTGTNSSNEITLNVTPVNDPPWYKRIDNKSWNMNTNLTIDLNDYFGDVDGDELNFSYTKPDHINVTLDTEDKEIILSPETDWNGTSKITLDAYDGEYNTSSEEITLKVVTTTTTTTGNAPSIDSYSPEANPSITINEQGATIIQQFNITKSDPDGSISKRKL